MEKGKTISVWLTLNDGENKGKIALQRRSAAEQSFPLVYQATWAGKVEDGEEIETAIKRECEEELGKEFCKKFDFLKLELFSKGNFTMKGGDWTCYNYIGKVDEVLLKTAKLHKEAFPEFVFFDKGDDLHSIVLFDDQYKVFKNILNGN